MKAIRVYRCGALTPAEYKGEVAEYSAQADAARPAGRAGRQGSLYGSASLAGVGRWTDANHRGNVHEDVTTYEISIDPTDIFVYSVEAWEEFSWHGKPVSEYWNSGIPLADFERIATERGLDHSQWEILFPADSIKSSRGVSNKRLITAQPEGSLVRSNLMWTLERNKAFRSIMW